MALTLDSGALGAFRDALLEATHPLRKHVQGWTKDKVVLSTPPVVWAEFWRGRGSNDHYVAKVRERVRVADVTREDAERAAGVLQRVYGAQDSATVAHLVDALLMAQANRLRNTVYTSDAEDLVRLFPHFEAVKAIVDCGGNIRESR